MGAQRHDGATRDARRRARAAWSALALLALGFACNDPASRASATTDAPKPASGAPRAEGDGPRPAPAPAEPKRAPSPPVATEPKPASAPSAPRDAPAPPQPAAQAATGPQRPVIDGYEVVSTFPHDADSFTQGLVFDGGRLIESQGQYGESSLRLVELETGKVLKKLPLDARFFAEGCAVLKGLVYQLTWREETVFVYDARELRPVGSFRIAGDAWGITSDGASLIVSDGTDELRFLDPQTHAVTRRLPVRVGGLPVTQLNELEWVDGEVWANVWHSDLIARIDPKSGAVLRYLDLRGLLPVKERRNAESVLNGIAYDAASKRLFVTGKNWPKLFEIRVKQRS